MRALGLTLLATTVLNASVMAQEPGQALPQHVQSGSTPKPPSAGAAAPSASTSTPAVTSAAGASASPASRPASAASAAAPASVARVAGGSSASTRPAASPTPAAGPDVVLVLESSGGLRAAAELRAALNQVGYRVLSPADAQHKAVQPDALLTVAFSPPAASGARSVHVAYWGRDGRSDRLTAASLATLDQLNAVALAFSSALIDRHQNDGPVLGDASLARTSAFGPNAPTVLYAMVTNAPRTNVHLRFEDF